jgi:hypothetical protein
MDRQILTIPQGNLEGSIFINTSGNRSIASIATNSELKSLDAKTGSLVTGMLNLKIMTYWENMFDDNNSGSWLPILSEIYTPAILPLYTGYASIFNPNIDLRGETQIKFVLDIPQDNDIILHIKFTCI